MRKNSTGILALFVVGGYYLYRNRFQIQKYLESLGVRTPLDTSNIGNAIRSGVAKISGGVEGELNQFDTEKKAV